MSRLTGRPRHQRPGRRTARPFPLLLATAMAFGCLPEPSVGASFEAEAGTLAGRARIGKAADASRGDYVELDAREPAAPSPGLAALPPMGFNQYNHFGLSITESVMRDIA